MNILIVDDDDAIRDAFGDILRDEGYAVATAANGQEALAYLRQTSQLPDLILLDLAMPVMSGWEFRAAQRQDPVLQAIPVVVVSADRGAQQHPATIDVDAYLPKPVLLETLLDTVERFVV
jgi:CheY-like chemotaxis protein